MPCARAFGIVSFAFRWRLFASAERQGVVIVFDKMCLVRAGYSFVEIRDDFSSQIVRERFRASAEAAGKLGIHRETMSADYIFSKERKRLGGFGTGLFEKRGSMCVTKRLVRAIPEQFQAACFAFAKVAPAFERRCHQQQSQA